MQQTTPDNIRRRQTTVLVIDDDKLIRDTAQRILAPFFRVICRADDTDGIAAAEEELPDLILLDINLEGKSGFDVLKALKSSVTTRDIPVMFITGETSEDMEVRAFRCGASDYVRKPFVPEVLIQRSKRVIDLYHYQSGLKSEVTRQTARADRLSLEMMIALSKTVDAKDHYTNGHSGRVADYSAEIARRMGKSFAEQEKIFEMGLMHDIGKIGVSEEILNKTSRLTDEEFAQIKKHTVIGYDILSSIEEMPDLSVGARSHHEKFNGTGYPDGLAGSDIPEAARIICLADCYDAMTSRRTYSTPRSQEAVRAEIERCSGTQFDPDIAKILLGMIDDDPEYKMNQEGGIMVWKNRDMLWNIRPDTDSAADDTAEQENSEIPTDTGIMLPEWLSEIGEIDVSSGLLHCGSDDTYLSALTTYAGSVISAADDAEAMLKNGDIRGATVRIHSLKSTSRVIGAMKLGALAEELEAAGNANDTEKLNSRCGELFSRCRALGKQLAPLLVSDSLPLITGDGLNEAYTLIREFLSVEDYESAMQIVGGLEGFSFPDSDKKRCEALIRAAKEFDYDAMSRIMNSNDSAAAHIG
ncbi:MAG: HD domain-containing protein [Ruminiclostridium sp.]|nr:HD domain-containing protein [Ruminiclostridium sp.]